MMDLNLAIVGLSYQGRGETTTVEIFARSHSGISTVILVQGLRPWLEVARPGPPKEIPLAKNELESIEKELLSIPKVQRVEGPTEKWTDLGNKPVWRIFTSQPWDVPGVRREIDGRWIPFSSDIIFGQRLLLDRDLGPHLRAKVKPILWTEKAKKAHPELGEITEVDAKLGLISSYGGAGDYPVDLIATCELEDLEDAEVFSSPWRILSFDLETSVETGIILCAAAVIQQNNKSEIHQFNGPEIEILKELTSLVRKLDPDIITGYNIENFDLPVLFRRASALSPDGEKLAELFGWGRVPNSPKGWKRTLPNRRENNRTWRIPGRVVMDAWWEARKSLRPRRESLAAVSALIWPDDDEMRKMEVDASKMDEEWATRPETVMKYCIQDAKLPLRILEHIDAVRRAEALATVAKIPLETSVTGTTSQWIDSLVIRLADKANVAVPRSKPRRDESSIEGGYVHDVKSGLHTWVAVLDVKSMYPSIMIENNICATTRIDTHHSGSNREVDAHEAPTGARFLTNSTRLGLVPQLLIELMKARDHHKKAASMAEDHRTAAFHDRLQYSVKILMNSFYGVFASTFYRFTHPDLGASITAWARRNIKAIISGLETEGHEVIYSDTDSVFVAAPMTIRPPPQKIGGKEEEWNNAVSTLCTFGEEVAERFSNSGATLEFESGMSAFFSHGAKKRYVGQLVYPREEMLVRGYEPRRTDSFQMLTNGLESMFSEILNGNTAGAVHLARSRIEALKKGDIEVNDLVMSRSCKGKMNDDGTIDFTIDYVNPDGLPYVQAAKKRIASGLSFTPGMKVSWIVTDASSSPMIVEPWLVDEIDASPPTPDLNFYLRRVTSSWGRITEAFGWSAEDLRLGSRQVSLFSFG